MGEDIREKAIKAFNEDVSIQKDDAQREAEMRRNRYWESTEAALAHVLDINKRDYQFYYTPEGYIHVFGDLIFWGNGGQVRNLLYLVSICPKCGKLTPIEGVIDGWVTLGNHLENPQNYGFHDHACAVTSEPEPEPIHTIDIARIYEIIDLGYGSMEFHNDPHMAMAFFAEAQTMIALRNAEAINELIQNYKTIFNQTTEKKEPEPTDKFAVIP